MTNMQRLVEVEAAQVALYKKLARANPFDIPPTLKGIALLEFLSLYLTAKDLGMSLFKV